MRRPIRTLLAALALSAAAFAAAAQGLTIEVGKSATIRLPEPAGAVFVADPAVADVQLGAERTLFVLGVGPGTTDVVALDEAGGVLERRRIRVRRDLGELRRALAARFPTLRLRLTEGPNSLMVEGAVDTPADADAVSETLAGALGPEERLINRLSVAAPVQVNLRVRVVEVSRDIDQRLGFNWNALFNIGSFSFRVLTGVELANPAVLDPGTFGTIGAGLATDGVDVNGLIDALDAEGLARTLAEPNLTAMSGETASFTAGGEFPIPVAQDEETVSIEFKPFGVILDFTPTVLSPDRISLRVRPEVSELSDQGAIRIGELVVPALSVRRVETTVELASGQSLVIGGLLRQSTRDQIEKVPGLGDVPVLGTLFTSTRYQNEETELLVSVTPYVVRPTRPEALGGPIAPRARARSLEALLARRAPGVDEASVRRLHGPVGFAY